MCEKLTKIYFKIKTMMNFKECLYYEMLKYKNNDIKYDETIYGLLQFIRSKTALSLLMIKEIYVTFSSSPAKTYINVYTIKLGYNNNYYDDILIKISKSYKIKINLNNPLIYYINKHLINHLKHIQIGVIKPKKIDVFPINTIYSFEILK